MTHETTRRETLQAGTGLVGLAALGGLAGCSGMLGESGGDELDDAPGDAGAAAYVDAEAVRTDDATEAVVNAWLGIQAEREFYDGPEDFQGMLDDFEEETGLDPSGLSSMTPFFAWSEEGFTPFDQEFYAFRFRAEWSEDEVVGSLEDSGGASYEESEHEGVTVYEPDTEFSPQFAVLEEGTYLLGTADAVTATIDVREADGEAMDQSLRDAYANTRSGPVRFVSTIPERLVPESGPDAEVQFDILTDVEHVAGSIYADGDVRGIETTFATGDESTADDLSSVLDGFFTLGSDEARNEALAGALGEIEVEQSGTDVVVTYEATVEDLVDLIESANRSSGGSSSRRRAPQATFSFDYDAEAERLTVTHYGGDAIRRDELYVRGSGFTDADADMTGPGQWQGTASGTAGSQSAVVAGDSVTVGFASDGVLQVVWQSEDGNAAATLEQYRGPDA